MSNIEIYKTADGKTEIDVKLDKETVWLTQKQMSVLFEKDVRTVNEHIKNVYSEGELEKYPTIRKFRIVQNEGGRDVEREINHYNLDVIISVGYRIKSQRGTDFRKWATSKLRDYIVRGYTLNISRLQERQEKLKELFNIVNKLEKETDLLETKGLLKIISDYYNALVLFDNYDNGKVEKKEAIKENYKFSLKDANAVVNQL